MRPAFLLIMITISISGCEPPVDKDGLHYIDARVNVKNSVLAKLKDPNSASFTPLILDFDKENDNRFTTSGSVDAKNSFGGTIRTRFTAAVDKQGKVIDVSVGQ